MKTRIRAVWFAAGVLIFFLVVRRTRWADFTAAFSLFDWRFALLAFVAYAGVNAARVERLVLILGPRIGRRDLFGVVFIQNFLNSFFSFAGDGAYVSLLRRKKIAWGENVSSLLTVKACDLIMLAAIFLAAIFFTGSPRLAPFRAPAALLLALAAGAVGFAGARPAAASRVLARIGHGAGVARRPLFSRIVRTLQEISSGFSLLLRRDIFLKIFLATLANWLLTFLCGFFLFRGAGIGIGAAEAVFAYTLPILASLTPAHALGGIGTFEASLISGLALVGVSVSAAIPASIIIHLEELVFLAVLGAAGFLAYDFRKESPERDRSD